jgi:hypothetical protein
MECIKTNLPLPYMMQKSPPFMKPNHAVRKVLPLQPVPSLSCFNRFNPHFNNMIPQTSRYPKYLSPQKKKLFKHNSSLSSLLSALRACSSVRVHGRAHKTRTQSSRLMFHCYSTAGKILSNIHIRYHSELGPR